MAPDPFSLPAARIHNDLIDRAWYERAAGSVDGVTHAAIGIHIDDYLIVDIGTRLVAIDDKRRQ